MENDVSTVLWPDRRTKVLESKSRHESAEGLSLRLLLWLNVKLQVSPCATAKRVPLEAHEPCPLHPATPPTPMVTPPTPSHLNNWVWQQFKRLPAFVCTPPAKSSTFYFISPRTCLASRNSWGNCKWKWPCQWASTMCCPNRTRIPIRIHNQNHRLQSVRSAHNNMAALVFCLFPAIKPFQGFSRRQETRRQDCVAAT